MQIQQLGLLQIFLHFSVDGLRVTEEPDTCCSLIFTDMKTILTLLGRITLVILWMIATCFFTMALVILFLSVIAQLLIHYLFYIEWPKRSRFQKKMDWNPQEELTLTNYVISEDDKALMKYLEDEANGFGYRHRPYKLWNEKDKNNFTNQQNNN